jgi:hypothetical protein
MAHTHSISDGTRVGLRLARARDETSVKALAARIGAHYSDLDIARLVRFDPRQWMVICARALWHGTEVVVGVGAIRLDRDQPELLVVDDRLGEELGELMRHSLRELQRARAA